MRVVLLVLGVVVLLLAAAIAFRLIEFVPDKPAVKQVSAANAVDTAAPSQ